MSVTELKAAFADLAATVTPDPDPYPGLRRQWRVRRRIRLASIGATALAVLAGGLVGPGLIGGAGDPPADPGLVVTSEWAWRLIDSPVRGNLAGDTALVDAVTKAFDGGQVRYRRLAGVMRLDNLKVLFVNDVGPTRTALVAYYNGSAAMVVHATAPRDASPSELAVASSGYGPVPGLVVVSEFSEGNYGTPTQTVGLAPAGCEIATSASATVAADGSIQRTWVPSPTVDYVVAAGVAGAGAWRVTCDGEVRQVGPGGPFTEELSVGAPPLADPPAASDVRGTVDAATARTALAVYQSLVGRAGLVGGPQVRWGGSLASGVDPAKAAVLIGSVDARGPLVLLVGDVTKAMLATDASLTPRSWETIDSRSREEWSLVSTGVAASGTVIAVRAPRRMGGHAELSDQVVVIGPRGAVTVEAVDGTGATVASGQLTDGAGVLAVPYGPVATLRVLDSTGATVGSTPFVEAGPGPRLFGEPFFANW